MKVQEAKEILEYYEKQEWFLEKDQPAKNAFTIAIECMEEVEQYRALGTVEELKEAMEKQVAKKPKYKTRCEKCGTHNSVLGRLANPKGHPIVYCWNCGQANEIDWEEGAEDES